MSEQIAKTEVRLFGHPHGQTKAHVNGMLAGIASGKIISIAPRSITIPVSTMDGPLIAVERALDPQFEVTYYCDADVMTACCVEPFGATVVLARPVVG